MQALKCSAINLQPSRLNQIPASSRGSLELTVTGSRFPMSSLLQRKKMQGKPMQHVQPIINVDYCIAMPIILVSRPNNSRQAT